MSDIDFKITMKYVDEIFMIFFFALVVRPTA